MFMSKIQDIYWEYFTEKQWQYHINTEFPPKNLISVVVVCVMLDDAMFVFPMFSDLYHNYEDVVPLVLEMLSEVVQKQLCFLNNVSILN